MSFTEPLSPNVTYIAKSPFEKNGSPLTRNLFSGGKTVKIHWLNEKPAVYEIDLSVIQKNDISDIMKSYFKTYEKAGKVYPVSVTGLKDGIDEGIGSHRFCTYDRLFADRLTEVVRDLGFMNSAHHKNLGYTDFHSVSNYFRFMRYESGGEHFPHWDTDFDFGSFSDGRYLTTHTLVMYFDDCETGEIAFVNNKNVTGRHPADKGDWTCQARDKEIWLKIKPKCGKIVIFNHDLCHTVLPFSDEGGIRTIARGDLIYKDNL